MTYRKGLNKVSKSDSSTSEIAEPALDMTDKILLFLIYLYPLFRHTIGQISIVLYIGALAAFLFAVRNFNLQTRFGVIHLCWVILAVWAFCSYLYFDNSLTRANIIVFLYSILMFLVLSGASHWIDFSYELVTRMLFVHAAATILFFFLPDLYTSFMKPTFFANSNNAIGYQSGLTNHYSYNGMLQAAGFLMSFAKLLTDARESTRAKVQNLAVFLIFAFALVLTEKRAPSVCALIALVLAFLVYSRRLKFQALCTLIICALLAVGALSVISIYAPDALGLFDRLSEITTSSSVDESTSGRTYLWAHAIELWEQSPLLGNGWGTYRYRWSALSTSVIAHSIYLNLLAEAGVVGLAIFLVAAQCALKSSFHALLTLAGSKGLNSRAVAFSFAYQLFFLSYGFFGGPLTDMECYTLYFMIACPVAIGFAVRSAAVVNTEGKRQRGDNRLETAES